MRVLTEQCPWPSGLHNVVEGKCTRCGAVPQPCSAELRGPTRWEQAEFCDEDSDADGDFCPAHAKIAAAELAYLATLCDDCDGSGNTDGPVANGYDTLVACPACDGTGKKAGAA